MGGLDAVLCRANPALTLSHFGCGGLQLPSSSERWLCLSGPYHTSCTSGQKWNQNVTIGRSQIVQLNNFLQRAPGRQRWSSRSRHRVQSQALAAGKQGVQPAVTKATDYVPPFSKDLLDSLLVEMPPHLLQELREKVQTRLRFNPADAAKESEDESLFAQVVEMMGEYHRNLLYELPGESLEEVQDYLTRRGRILYIAESKINGAGRGGFAKVPIKAGTVITQYINERQLLNAPGLDSRPGSVTNLSQEADDTAESDSEPEVSTSEKYDYYGSEDDWPTYAIPHLFNDHTCLRGPDLYHDPALKMAEYLRGVAARNNVAFVERWGERFAVATRDISAGEELLWSYGISWWLDVERENMFMIMLWIASEQRELAMGVNEREMVKEAWSKIRILEEAAQAGKAMELEVVGKYGVKAREEVYVMQPLPKLFEDVQILKEQLVPFYADILEIWKRDTFEGNPDMLRDLEETMFG